MEIYLFKHSNPKLFTTMKQLLILLVILSSCSQSPSKSNADLGSEVINDSIDLNSDSSFIPTYVIDEVIKHYNDTSGKMKSEYTDSSVSIVWFFREEQDGGGVLTENNSDSSWSYQAEDTNNVNSGENDLQSDYPSDIGGISQTIDFSKLVRDHVKGDINHDGNDDLVITVMVSGGGSAAWNEIFTFILQGNKYTLFGVTRGTEISGCSDGNFTPLKIVNGQIVGTSTCWGPEDASCCPSLEYNTTVAFEGKGLKFVSKVKVK